MLSILLSRHRRSRMTSVDGKAFYGMCLTCLVLCVLETAGFFLDGRPLAWGRQLALLCSAAVLCLALLLALLWICYVDYRLFQDRRRLVRFYSIGAIPAVLLWAAVAANLFFPVFFWVGEDYLYYRTALFFLPCGVVYGYLTHGAVLSYRYRKQLDRYLFMPVLSFLIPVYGGSLIQLLNYGIALIWVSTALGLTFLYINLQSEDTYLDPLTGLYNRNYLMHYAGELPRQLKTGGELTGILLDINGFKRINDTFGHIRGDAVLRAVGKILQTAAAGTDASVIRYGGDEFLILLPSAAPEEVRRIQDRIRRELDRYNAAGDLPFPVSFSSGVSRLEGRDLSQFFQVMDRAMYLDKERFYFAGPEGRGGEA